MRAISPAASLRGLSIYISRTSEALCHTWLELDRPVRTPPVCGCYRKSLVVASPNEVQPAGSLSSFVGSSPGHKQTETSLSNRWRQTLHRNRPGAEHHLSRQDRLPTAHLEA